MADEMFRGQAERMGHATELGSCSFWLSEEQGMR